MKTTFVCSLAFTCVAAMLSHVVHADQEAPAIRRGIIQIQPAGPAAPATEAPTPEAKPEDATVAATPAVKVEPVDPRIIRMALNDGTLISGRLSITSLAVDTKFGRLNIPIEKIRYVKPGLDSRPGAKEKIAGWIEQLGSANVDERKAASGELFKLGLPVRETLRGFLSDASGVRVAEIKTLIDKINEEASLDSIDPTDLTTLDVIATTDFTLTGRIVPQAFELASDFGDLKMQLTQLVKLDRDTGEAAEERKTITVSQQNFIARSMKSTGLRVTKGDKLTIRATGQLTMTRWGNAIATPEGASNTGWYLSGKIYNGALCLRIGNAGQIIKVGNALTLTAAETGMLHLGIAMNNRYTADGYDYPGEFKVDVKLQKK